VRLESVSKGTRHAGIILFDLCGAGAFGGVIIAGGFSQEAYSILSGTLPLIVIPFVLAALLQTAQGSRVTTAVVTAEILGATTIAARVHPLAIILLICGGCCLFSYVSDPFFWLVKRIADEEIGAVVRNYTFPLAVTGLILFCIGVGVQVLGSGLSAV
jgi:GntP family gluconate:H+ symporter